MPAISRAELNEDRVRLIAHTLWIEEGKPEGRADIHWFKALELVDAEVAAAGTSVKRKAPAAAVKKAAPRKRS